MEQRLKKLQLCRSTRTTKYEMPKTNINKEEIKEQPRPRTTRKKTQITSYH